MAWRRALRRLLLTLNFGSSIASGVSFSNFVVRYQGIEYPQGQTGSGSGVGRGCIVAVDCDSAAERTCQSPPRWRCSAWACSARAWWVAASGKLVPYDRLPSCEAPDDALSARLGPFAFGGRRGRHQHSIP